MSGVLKLVCDSCSKVFRVAGESQDEAGRIVELARKFGWTGSMTRSSTDDRCPECTEKGRTQPEAGGLVW